MNVNDLNQLAEIFDAGWDVPELTKNAPAGDAVAIALNAMAEKTREIAQREAGETA